MAQITWRNIDAPDLTGVSRILDQAKQGFNDFTSGFVGISDDFQKQDATNVAALRENNKQDLADYLASFKTPDELAAAQASGAIDQYIAKFGGAIDREYARDADDKRLAYARNQVRDANTWNDENALRNARGQINQGALKALTTGKLDPGFMETMVGLPGGDKYMQDAFNRTKLFQDKQFAAEDQQMAWNSDRRQEARLGMDQESHGWEATEFGQRQAEYKDRLGAYEALNNVAATRNQLLEQSKQQYDSVAKNLELMGISLPRKSDGSLDLANFTPDQQKAFKQTRDKLGYKPAPTDSEILRGYDITLGKFATLSPETRLNMLELADKSLSQTQALASTDNEQVKLRDAALDEALAKNAYKDIEKREPLKATNDLIAEFSFKVDEDNPDKVYLGQTGNINRTASIKDLTRLMAKGMPVKDEKGNTTYVEIPTDLMRLALKSVYDGDWPGFNGDLLPVVKSLYKMGNYGEQRNNYDIIRQAKKDLLSAAKESKLPYDYNDIRAFDETLSRIK